MAMHTRTGRMRRRALDFAGFTPRTIVESLSSARAVAPGPSQKADVSGVSAPVRVVRVVGDSRS